MTEKPTIVFLPGLGCQTDSVDALGDLVNEYQVIPLNLPGHGWETVAGINNISDIAEVIHIKITSLKLINYILIGFSLGGLVAVRYAEKYHDDDGRLKGIVVWASPVGSKRRSLQLNTIFVVAWLKVMPASFFKNLHSYRLPANALKHHGLNLRNMSKSNLEYMTKLPCKEGPYDFANLVPKLFIFGTHDYTIGEGGYSELIHSKPNNSEVYKVPRGGHFGSKAGRNEALLIIKTWLAKLS